MRKRVKKIETAEKKKKWKEKEKRKNENIIKKNKIYSIKK